MGFIVYQLLHYIASCERWGLGTRLPLFQGSCHSPGVGFGDETTFVPRLLSQSGGGVWGRDYLCSKALVTARGWGLETRLPLFQGSCHSPQMRAWEQPMRNLMPAETFVVSCDTHNGLICSTHKLPVVEGTTRHGF